jgi:hypothetical protein
MKKMNKKLFILRLDVKEDKILDDGCIEVFEMRYFVSEVVLKQVTSFNSSHINI